MSLPLYLVALDVSVKFGIFSSLVVPLPFKSRKAYVRFLLTNGYVAKFVYFLKIVSLFIGLLFLDALRTTYTINFSPDKEAFNSGLDGGDPHMIAVGVTSQRKLAAERNFLLTATSLFLDFFIWRVFELNVENVRWGEIVHTQQGEDTGPPIEDHRGTFKDNYHKSKPDHEAAARKRNIANKDITTTEKDE